MPFPFTDIETDICELKPLDDEQVCEIKICIEQIKEEICELNILDEEQVCLIRG